MHNAPITVTTSWRHTGIAAPATFRRADVLAFEFWDAGSDGWRAFLHLDGEGSVVRLQADQAEVLRVYEWFTGRRLPLAELRRRSLRRELNAWRESWQRLLPDVQQRMAALEAELATLADWRHCRCGNACDACGGCRALSVGCGWDCCDGQGRVEPITGYEAQLAAEDAAERRAIRRRIAGSRRAA